jgi:hypothetical protein
VALDLSREHFKTGEVVKLFFNQTVAWFRHQEKKGLIAGEDGSLPWDVVENQRGGDRSFTLDDIEVLAANLLRNGVLAPDSFKVVMSRVEYAREPVRYQVRRGFPSQPKSKGRRRR